MTYQSARIYAPILIGIALFIAIFGLKPLYTDYMDVSVQADSLIATKEAKQKSLDDLMRLKQSIESATGTTEMTEKVKKLASKWSEADIISSVMLNDYTKGTEFLTAPISISSISVDTGKKLPSGLSLGSVQVVLSGKSVDDIISYLTYLTTSAPYIYTLDTIDLPLSAPIQEDVGGISLSVSLGVYYYQ